MIFWHHTNSSVKWHTPEWHNKSQTFRNGWNALYQYTVLYSMTFSECDIFLVHINPWGAFCSLRSTFSTPLLWSYQKGVHAYKEGRKNIIFCAGDKQTDEIKKSKRRQTKPPRHCSRQVFVCGKSMVAMKEPGDRGCADEGVSFTVILILFRLLTIASYFN